MDKMSKNSKFEVLCVRFLKIEGGKYTNTFFPKKGLMLLIMLRESIGQAGFQQEDGKVGAEDLSRHYGGNQLTESRRVMGLLGLSRLLGSYLLYNKWYFLVS